MTNGKEMAGRIIIGRKYAAMLRPALEKLALDIIEMPDNPLVDSRLSGHVDLAMLQTGATEVLIPSNLKASEIEETLHMYGIKTVYTVKRQGRDNPDDSILNVCLCGNCLIMNPQIADETVAFRFSDKRILSVKQGYTGCSVCKVGNEAIITADSGIHSAALKAGLESLLIKPGNIDLEGFDYGFIGGSSFMLNGMLMFTGKIEDHPSFCEIRAFLRNLSVDYAYLTDRTIFDIGGAVVLQQFS